MQPLAVSQNHIPIYRLESELLKLPQVDMPVDHQFCTGLYARTMHLVAGHAYTGAVHKGECFFVVRRGHLASYAGTDDAVMLSPGDMHIVPDGSKRAVVALTDCTVTTFHPNPQQETDPVALWDLFTTPAPAKALDTEQLKEALL